MICEQQKVLSVIILSLVLLLGGAFALYSRLGDSYAADQLDAEMPQQSEIGESVPRQIPAPDFTIYDAEGYAAAQVKGTIDSETLQRGIQMILPQ